MVVNDRCTLFQCPLTQISQNAVDGNERVKLGGTLGHLHNSPAVPCKFMWFSTKHLQCKHSLVCMSLGGRGQRKRKWVREGESGGSMVGGKENSDGRFEGWLLWLWGYTVCRSHIHLPSHRHTPCSFTGCISLANLHSFYVSLIRDRFSFFFSWYILLKI